MASGNDKEIKVAITAETAGADEAKRALEELKKTGEDLGKSTADAGKEAAEGLKLHAAAIGAVTDAKKEDAKATMSTAESAEAAAKALEWQTRAAERLAEAEKSIQSGRTGPGLGIDIDLAGSAVHTQAFYEARLGGAGFAEAEETAKKAEAATRSHLEALKETVAQKEKDAKVSGDQNEEGKKTIEGTKQLNTLLLGQGLGAAGEVFGKMASGLREAATSLKEVNPELAETAEQGAKAADVLSSVAGFAGAGMLTMGPWGAVIGGTVALLGELGSAWAESEAEAQRASKESLKEAEAVSKAMLDLVSRMRDANAEAERGSFRDWAEDLEAGADAIVRQNEELERNLRLSKERADAQAERERADTRLKIAKVRASDLPEEDKIRKINELESAQAERDSARKIAGLDMDAGAADARAKSAWNEYSRRSEVTRQTTERLAEEQQKQAAIDQANSQLKYFRGDEKSGVVGYIPQAEAALGGAVHRRDARYNWFSADSLVSGFKNMLSIQTLGLYDYSSSEDLKKREKEVEEKEAYLNELNTKLAGIAREASKTSSVKDAEKALADAKKAEEEGLEQAQRAKREAEEASARRDINRQTELYTFPREQSVRTVATNRAADDARKRAEEKKAAEEKAAADKAKREEERAADAAERAERERLSIGSDYSGIAKGAADIAARKKRGPEMAALDRLQDTMLDGADDGERQQMLALIERLIKLVGAGSPEGRRLHDMEVRIGQLEKRQATLQKPKDIAPKP